MDSSGAELAHRVERRLNRLGWIGNAAGVLVVSLSVGFLIPIFLDPRDLERLALLNAPVAVAHFVAVALLITRHLRRHLAQALGWLVEDRPPGEQEHRQALGIAVHMTKVDALAWASAALLFAVLNAVAHSWGFAAVVGATVWAGGETTCAVVYLAYERALRPVTACALAGRPAHERMALDIRGRLLMAWALGTGVPLIGVLVVGTVGLTESGVDTGYLGAAVLFLGLVATGASLLASTFAAKAIAEPVTSVRRGLERIEQGDLDALLPVDDGSEVGLLQAGFNRMAEGLRERERIRDIFGRQVGEEVARAALREGTRLGGEEREVGALFVDLVGSTSMAMAMPPTEVVRVLNRFFRVVVEVVEAEGGLVDKFEGDAALCVFGAPVPRDNPADDVLRSARALAARLSSEVPEVDFGIGISAGRAVAGNVGAERRFEYTVIGDPVNEAARLSELAKHRPERVLASEAALSKASDAEHAAWSGTEAAVLRGRSGPTGMAHPRS